MTSTINGHSHTVTAGDDVQGCVRAPSDPVSVPDPGGERESTARPRAISQLGDAGHANVAGRVRNFVSLHAREVKAATARTRTFNEQPMTVAEAWRQVLPGAEEASGLAARAAGTVAGLFRAVVLSLTYLVALAVGTRIAAGVALAVTLLVVVAGWTASTLL
jgi:hypothetical protein